MLKLQLQKNIGYYSYFQFSRLSGQETYDSRLQHLSEMVPAAPAAPAAPGRGLLATDLLNEEMFSTETLEPSKSLWIVTFADIFSDGTLKPADSMELWYSLL